MKEYTLLEEFLRIFRRYKIFIFLFNGIIVIGVIIYLLITPKWYVGSATMIITDQLETSSLSFLQNLLPGGILPNIGTDVDRYFVLANSRQILDKLIQKFKLDSIYDFKYKEDLYKKVIDDIKLDENDDGSITIECFYKGDPYRAAEMTNFLFEELKKLSIEISNKQAKDYRIFLEGIYNETISDIRNYEDSLKIFQQERGIFDVEEQAKQLISVLGDLEIQKIGLETEKMFIEKFQSDQSTQFLEVNQKIKIVQDQIRKIIETTEYTNIPLKELPETAIIYLRLYRNLKMKEKILEFLVPMLEKAKLDEKKNTVDIYLLDKAFPQQKKVKPQRLKILVISMILSGLLTFIFIKLKEFYEDFKLRTPK
jgi:uncharacterized protein involved in exopolysaccharide biosynthesis